MNIYALILLISIITVIEAIPLKKKKQSREIKALLVLGAVTLAYGYYYSTHIHTASIVDLLLRIFNIR